MRISTVTVLICCSALFSACGSSDEPQAGASPPSAGPPNASATPNKANSRVAATAAEVAKEARGKLRCPAKPTSAPRDPSLPVDDVVGVRPGMSYDDAVNVVLCSHELLVIDGEQGRGFKIDTYGQTLRQGFSAVFAEDRINKTSKEIMAEMQDNAIARGSNRRAPDMQGGTSRWYVTTMGLPNSETVLAAARIEAFVDGKSPTMTAVAEALAEKYGTPTRKQENPGTWVYTWAYDLQNRPITETSPMYWQCSAPSNPDSGVNLSPDCGLAISAAIMPMRDNPQLARTLEVGVVSQAQGYETLVATQQQLERMEQQRRAAEISAAAKNADKPTL